MAGLAGLLLFVFIGRRFEADFWTSWWFYVGLGLTVSAVFLEPYFSRPQDGILNGALAFGALWAASRQAAPLLWIAFAVVSGLALTSGVLAAILPDRLQRAKSLAYRLSTSLGRAVGLGGAALIIGGIGELPDGGQYLILATLALIAAIVAPWTELWALFSATSSDAAATAVTAFGPRMLLVDAAGSEFEVGARVDVKASNRSCGGTIISRMPHKSGLRYQIALDVEWHRLCRDFPTSLRVEGGVTEGSVLGTIGEGTTDTLIKFEPVKPVRVGEPVATKRAQDLVLYQVTSVELRRVGWEGSSALIPHATAMHVGMPRDGRISFEPALPEAHDVVEGAAALVLKLGADHVRLGKAVGTEIEVGINLGEARNGHLAILGMSGMGKTSVAKRICSSLGESNWVLALDTTGEYLSRLAFPSWPGGSYVGSGHWVYEPAGDPPAKARELIEAAMKTAHDEYSGGDDPHRRVILLEEAHGFVPEWNFATKNQQDHVSYSARMVMQARKFELSFVVVSQRTAVVSKSVLSQCENYVILKTVDETSLGYLEGIFGSVIRQAVPSLERFEAICAGPAFNSEGPVIVQLDPPDEP